MKSKLDPRLPIQGSIDYDKVMYLRLYELFKTIAKELDSLDARVKHLENFKDENKEQ